MGILSTLCEKVLNFTGRQLGYVLSYSDNFKKLEDEVERLNAAREDMERKVGAARNNNEEIQETVKIWMREVVKISAKAAKFLEEESHANTGCFLGLCPNLWLRYKLSREAKKMAAEVDQLNGKAEKFEGVSAGQMRPQGFRVVGEVFESRVSTMEEIMEALIDPAVHLIGLYGLGGVGKTTLAKQVAEKARDERRFASVLFVEVKRYSIKEIQNQIAYGVGLHFSTQSETESIRADQVLLRLKQEKSLLIVFDDLWERLDFNRVGIPSADEPNTQRKFIFTSRDEGLLCGPMNCKRIISVELLSEEEAWVLFKEMAEINEHSDHPDLVLKATEVSQKCARLPVAVVAVARALKNNKSLVDWEDALQRLKNYSSRNMSFIEEVDSSIKLSYDFLKPEELKPTFLLSAMFSQDPLIEDLVMYAIGLGFLGDVHNMEVARNRLGALVRRLKHSSLLLDSYSEYHFTIHDVVRDVALSIAFKEQHTLVKRREKVDEWPNEDQLERCTAICLDESDIDELPEEFYGPKVEFFYLHSKDLKLSMPSNFFRGMPKLKVLSLSEMAFSSLPSSISLLKKLVTLSLQSCILGDITVVEHLKKLKILNLSYSRIEELPFEVGQLSSLKILNLSYCDQLKVIPPNLLSNLKKLEELYMRESFNQWEAEGINEGKERASLDEVKHLQKNSTLEIDIPDTSILPKDLLLESSLERYKISIGECYEIYYSYEFSRTLRLTADNNINMEYGVFRLFENVEDLYLQNLNGIASLYQSHITDQTFCKLRAIKVGCCDKLKSLFLVSMARALSRLETIEVSDCESLEEIVAFTDEENVLKGSTMNVIEFPQLRSLKLNHLPALTDLCFSSKVLRSLKNLEELEIRGCDLLEVVFDFGQFNNHEETHTFRLKRLILGSLPKLKTVWGRGSQGVVIFSSLREVNALECESLENIFPASIAKGLSQLEELHISYCGIEGVVAKDECSETDATFVFPKLWKLEIKNCNKLKIFLDEKVTFPNLETLHLTSINCQSIFISKSSEIQISEIRESSQDPLPDRSFSNLKTLEVVDCKFLLILIPLYILKSLSNLKELTIIGCDLLEVVFDFGQFNNYRETHTFRLKRLSLGRLPKLKTVWGRGSQGVVIFSSLRQVEVWGCESLENIFPVSIAKGLKQLEELHIYYCGIEGVVAKDEFPEPDAAFVFPKLRKVDIKNCNKLKIFLDEKVLRSLQNLEELEIRGCDLLEVVFDFGQFNNYRETLTFRLKRLILERLPKLKTVWGRISQGVVIFSSLREVNAWRCESLENIFPVSIAKGLKQLEELHISYCGIEGVVAKDEFSEPDATFVFPKLRKLEIRNCNKLKIFLDEKVIPKLEELCLLGMHAKVMCQFREFHFLNVKFLSLSRIYGKEATFLYSLLHGFPNLEELQWSDSFHEVIFTCSESPLDIDARKDILIGVLKFSEMKRLKHVWDRKCRVDHILQNLKTLDVYGCGRLINLGSSFVSLQNLTVLDVSYCDELINLLTPSTARTLVQLTRLEIRECKKIAEIITDGEEDVEKEIIFKKLKTLELDGLSSFKSFCCHRYNFEFPLLDDVIIRECPKFRMFCPGDLTTPLLKGVKVVGEEIHWQDNLEEIHWQDNLNKTIQQLFDEKVLFKDQDVKIDEYPELIDIWNEKCVVSNPAFSNLTSLVVDKCAFLSSCVIPSYVLISLINLKKLEVRNCDSVVAVFDLEGIDIDKEAHTLQTIRLRELELRHLPNLKCIWNKDPHTVHCFRHLDVMSAYECESLRSIFPASIVQGISLSRLTIESCGIEFIVAEDHTPSPTIHFEFHLYFLRLVKLPNLKNFYPQRHTVEWPRLNVMDVRQCKKVKVFSWEDPKITEKETEDGVENQYPFFLFEKVIPNLSLVVLNQDHVKMIRNDQFQYDFFDGVETLGLDGFNEDEQLIFPYAFLERFPNLIVLIVSHSSFKDIFPCHGPPIDPSRNVPSFISLSLTHLDELQNIWNKDSKAYPVLQRLESLDVDHCYKLINLAPSSASFDNLKQLRVLSCHHLGYLLTTSTAKSLVRLNTLVVEDCSMMEEVVTNEGEDWEDVIRLNLLNQMKLIDLPILKNFCSQTCTFEFPSLRNVTIRGCSKMKMFCLGALATPLLEDMKVEEDEERWEGNLNETLEQLFLEKEGLNSLGG